MSNLFTYIITNDHGLAPNPFWGWCTLAVCSPNHQRSRVNVKGKDEEKDWIAGFTEKRFGYKLIYAMEVDELIQMNAYFNDPRFEKKKPKMNGGWQERCGDNFYSQKSDGSWLQHENPFHSDESLFKKDTRNPLVFVGRRFWYFGKNSKPIPKEFLPLVGGRSVRVNHPLGLAETFQDWVTKSFEQGISGQPRDSGSCTRIFSHHPDDDCGSCCK